MAEVLNAPIDEEYYRHYPTIPWNDKWSGDPLIRVLNQAWAYIQRITNNPLTQAEYTETLDHNSSYCTTRRGRLYINPRNKPLVSLTAVTAYRDGVAFILDPSKAVKRQTGWVFNESPFLDFQEGEVEVTYTAGFETIPDDLKYVCAMVTSHILSGSMFPADGSIGEGSLLPQWVPAECKSILNKYTRYF